MNADYIKSLITALKFAPENGKNAIYVKRYPNHNNYAIYIDFNKNKIEYACQSVEADKRIRVGDLTTSNFDKAENFVVLECVDRLLTKGYSPANLELEKKYPLGHNFKGKLDVLIYNESARVPFLMIECKAYGSEYEKATLKTLKDGGQLFSYYQQDKAAKYLCLYTSHLDKQEIEYKNNIIVVEDSWCNLSSVKDVFDYWNKNFKDNGIFESYTIPYDIKPKALTYGMLKNLKEEDSGKIYNQIMEILRHNAISDKPNAFNKLLNLFVCKIIDENQNPDDELSFQWLESDTDESLQMRLNDLYKEGMWRFLEIKIIDHSEEDVTKVLEGIDNSLQRQRLIDMFRDARLKKSPNFAFVEVLDEKTFRLNAKIIREIVELLQVYKFRYQQKHEFLGNFFELLLNTSMKQEVGQFFTPVPITRFIISSLPLKEFVQSKIDDRARDILPIVIDYACGSGHFLTEYMNQMQDIIDSKIDISKATPTVKSLVKTWTDTIKFAWARDYVYGIDMDNRLVKTAKISAFFNGDGEANIIWANGLDHFEKSEEYRALLNQVDPYSKKNNGQFDILISNPPYSVEAFKSTIKHGDKSFELFSSVTDNSSEIECLFVERMKQLLKVGGWAGVILPSSIFANGGIYSKAREIIFKYFRIKSIVELGSSTFMKTGTNTVVLFLERRTDSDFIAIEKAITAFINNFKDVTVMGIENAFSKYVADVYDNLAFNDYISFLKGKASDFMQKHELFSDYKQSFGDDLYTKAVELEKEKLLYFLLTYEQDIALIKTGEKKKEKEFLGYEFSERRGHEGMKCLPGGTKLFDESGDLMNPRKANSYIYNAFLGKRVDIDEGLSQNITYRKMSGLIHYGTSKFDKIVNLNSTLKYKPQSRYPIVAIRELSKIITKGTTPTTLGFAYVAEGINFIKIENITNDGEISGELMHITSECNEKLKRSQLQANDILFSIAGSFGRIVMVSEEILPANTNQALAIIRGLSDRVIPKYFVEVLRSGFVSPQIIKFAKGIAQYNISLQEVGEIVIPLPPHDIQYKIVTEIEYADREKTRLFKEMKEKQAQIEVLIDKCFSGDYGWEQLGNITKIYNGGTPNTANKEYWNGDIHWATLVDTKDKYLFSTQRMITKVGLDSCNAVLLPINSVLFSSRATIGDVSIAKVPVSTNQGYKNFVCNESKLNYEYLYYILRHEAKEIKDLAGGMTYPEISKTLIATYKIPLPSIDDQQKIVTAIESIETEIADIKKQLTELNMIKNKVLEKYL